MILQCLTFIGPWCNFVMVQLEGGIQITSADED